MEKPFHLQELEARIRSLTRRKFVQKDVCLESGEIKFDTVRREAYAKGEMVSLTRKENGILEYLLLNMGRPVSQEELMEHVWDASVDSFSGAIESSSWHLFHENRRTSNSPCTKSKLNNTLPFQSLICPVSVFLIRLHYL